MLEKLSSGLSTIVLTNHISVKTAAVIFGYSNQYIRRLLRTNKIGGVKVGSIWLVQYDEIKDFVNQAKNSNDRRCGPHNSLDA